MKNTLLIIALGVGCVHPQENYQIVDGYLRHHLIDFYSGIQKESGVYSLLKNTEESEKHFSLLDKHDLWGKEYISLDIPGGIITLFLHDSKNKIFEDCIFQNPHELKEKKISHKIKILAVKLEEGVWLSKKLIYLQEEFRDPTLQK